MKNKISLLVGTLFFILFVLFLNGFLQYIFLLFFNANIEGIQFSMFGFSPIINLPEYQNIYFATLLLLSPIIIDLILVESFLLFLNKLSLGLMRYSIIVFLIAMAGYIIIAVFYGMIELILVPSSNSLWGKLIGLWQLVGGEVYVFVSFVLLALFTYLQFFQKRLMRYLIIEKLE